MAAGALAFLAAISVALAPIPATAVELPPAGNAYWIQTNGPNSLITLGDWYTSGVAGGGAGYHYVQFQVPCGWPAGTPISVDLFSPEENRVAGGTPTHEEPNGNYDSTQFELYGPGATVGPGYASPAPGAGIAGTRTTYQPGAAGVAEAWVRFATLSAPVTCGSYVLRSQVLTADPLNPGGTGDDQNGWKLRVGNDNDANPNNATPANYDNPDGVAGTNDELMVGMAQVSFQQSSGAVACQTFYEYTTPGQASATFNNFDMDGNTRLRYYAPGDPAYDATATAGGTVGTMSGNGIWNNGGTLAGRVGDTIASPTTGWWRIVNCLSDGNQLIQEGQPGVLSYYAQPPTPNMTLTKTDAPTVNAAPGQALTYNITATNTAAATGAANNVVVTDTIPAGFTYTGCSIPTPAQGTWTCSQAAGVVTFTETTGWINRNSNAVLRVTGTVNQGVSGTITNTARVNYKDALGNPFAQVTATDVDNIVPSSNLSITKTDSSDPENPGQAFNYTLTVNNAGPSNATNLVVSDTIPSQYTVTSVTSPSGSCGNVGNVVTCNLAAFASGAAAWVITVTVTVKATTVGGTYVNTATVSATEADPTPANNTVNNNNTVRATGNLSLTKTDGVVSVTVGSSTTYTITVTNSGPDIEPVGVVITDNIPAGTTGTESEADCTIVAAVFRCTTAATLAPGASKSYLLTVTVPAGYASATLVNTASITTRPITDPDLTNNSATDTDAIGQANLSITKADSIDPVNPGQAFTYTLTVNNAGPSTATSLVVSDTVPSQYTVGSVTSPTGVCGNAGNVVTCTLASMNSGAAAWVITVNVTAKVTTPGGTYVNTATVSSSTNDPTPANNTVNNNNTVAAFADLTLTKSDSAATVTAGTSTTYTITITNNGPSTEPAGVRFTDTIPAGTVGSEAETDCGIVGTLLTCTTAATIASGATKSYQLTLAVPSGYVPATVVNTATITVRPIIDPNLGNNSATDTDNVTRSADLSITKTDSIDPVTPGQAFTYTLTVTNNGPSDAATLTVSDTVPAQFTVTNVTSPAGACGHAGNVVTCTRPTFVNLATWVITVSVTTTLVAPGGTYANTATVSAATGDPVAANNSASQNTTVSVTADLAVTKTDGVASIAAGTSTTYAITLTNNGPSAVAAGVVVSDPIPAGTIGSELEPNCVIGAGPTFTCTTTAVLNSGGSVVYHLILAVATGYAPATLVNTASITSSPATDPTPANNTATDTDTVTKSTDLSIAKTDGLASVTAGGSTLYTITITNNGPSDEPAGVVVSDAIPAGTLGSETEADCDIVAGTFSCTTAAPIVSGGFRIYQLTLAVAASFAPANLVNSASITSAPATDPNAGNNTATDTDTVTRSADLSIVKTDSIDPVHPGQTLTYILTVTNNGPSDASSLTVSDTVPAQFAVTNVTSPTSACGNVGNLVTCTQATLAAGGSSVITVFVTANPAATAGVYTNTATVNSATADPVPGNNSGSQDTTIVPSADLSIVKSDSADPVNTNTSFNYIIVVTNNGPSDADNVQVTDTIPDLPLFSITGMAAGAGTCGKIGNDVTCDLASLASGATWTITVTVLLNNGTLGGLYTDTANVSSTTFDPDLANNAGSQSTIVLPAADMVVTKTDGVNSIDAGSSTTYTITLRNDGPSTEPAGLVLSDSFPASVIGSTSEGDCSVGPGTFSCLTSLPILPLASVTYHLTLDVPPDYAPATLINTATITSTPVVETDPTDNSATDTDTVVKRGELAITKTDGVPSVIAGTSTTYTITATNSGPSQIPAGVVISDPIPPGTVSSGAMPPGCAVAASTFTCTTSAPMDVLDVVSYQLTLDVAPDFALGTLDNTASVASPAVETNLANNSATDSDTVNTSADLSITKDDGVASVIAGNPTTYTIVLTNNGPSTEPAGVVLSDPIPAGMVGSTSDPNCGVPLGTVFTCTTTAPLAPAASRTYHLTLAVPPDTSPGFLINTVSIASAPTTDPVAGNNTDSDTDSITQAADLSVTKSDGVGSVIAGTSTTYTVTLTNNGPSTEPAGVVIDDPIPAGVTTPSSPDADCVIGASFTCTTTAPLAPGAFVTYHLTLAVPANSAMVSLANTATITPAPIPDPDGANNTDTDTDTVTTSANLSIVKTDSADPISPGNVLDYTMTVTNNGPSDAQTLQVTDSIPGPGPGPGFTITGIVASAGSCGWSGNNVNCTLASLARGTTWTITVSVVLHPLTPGGLYTDTAIVSSATTDPVLANNSDSEGTIVLPAADMVITKSDGTNSIDAGTSTTYTITLRNDGPSTQLPGAIVSDPIPVGIPAATNASTSSPDCAIAAGVFTCTTSAPIDPGDSVSYQLTLLVPSNYGSATLANTATITYTPITETDPLDNAVTDTDTVTASADLAITKTGAPDPVVAGNDVTYTLTVTNLGPSDATGVVVTDTLPGAVTFVSATPSQGGACTELAGVVTCPIGAVPRPGTATVTIVVTTTIDGSITDTAVVSSSTPDPALPNNTASATTTVTASADLAITKTDAPDPVALGRDVTYTITVRNNGPSDAVGVIATDALPGFTNLVSAVPTQGSCSLAGAIVTCPLGGLALGSTATIAVIVTPSVVAVITDVASVTATTPDLVPANNVAIEDTTVTDAADLAISKTDSADPVVIGDDVTYTVTVTNPGPSDAIGVVVTDTLPGPGSVTFGSATPSQGSCSLASGVVTCPLGLVAVGATATITIVVTTTMDGLIADTAVVSSSTFDPALLNNTDGETTAVTASADLAITKTDGVATITAGTSTTYAITVTNNGPSTELAGVVVSDPIPAGTTGTETETDCAIAASVFTCTTSAPLASGASVVYQLVVAIPGNYAPASVSNTASISAFPVLDPNNANNAATDVDAVSISADLGITKTDGVASVTPGSSTTFTITVTNAGPSSVPPGIVVSDPIPAGTTVTENEADCTIASATFTCTTSAPLASGASVVYLLVVAIPATYVDATLVNTASISFSPVPDPNPANGSSTDTDTVTPIVDDLSIVKTDSADPVAPGDSFSYTIVVSNAGPDAAPNVVVTDPVPPAFTVTAVSSSQGSCTNTANLVSCTLPLLAVGSPWTITVHVDVPAGAASGSVINTASVTGIGDTTLPNDAATQSTTVGIPGTASADLVLTIVVDDATPNEGDVVTYTIDVTNKGPDDASGVVVTDLLPNGVTYVSSRSARGSYKPGTGAWDIGALAARRTIRLAPGQSVTLQIDAMVDTGTAGTTIHNPAAVTQLDQVDPTPRDDADTAPISVTKVSGTGGSTAFTGFSGEWVFAWMFLFAMLGLAFLGLERVARRLSPIPTRDVDEDTPGTSSRPGRFLAEPFFFFRKE